MLPTPPHHPALIATGAFSYCSVRWLSSADRCSTRRGFCRLSNANGNQGRITVVYAAELAGAETLTHIKPVATQGQLPCDIATFYVKYTSDL
jgi:hypothetical protein